MDTLFDYIRWIGNYSFDQIEPEAVDFLILSSLSYVKFEKFYKKEERLEEIAQKVLENAFSFDYARVENDFTLLRLASESTRFRNLIVYNPEAVTDTETQFAALTFHDNKRAFIVYRGTDATLVGWKEDFNMSFMKSVSSDKRGLEYLKKSAEHFKKERLYLSGHSKGGHIAQYAFLFAPENVRERIISCYSFDGPGFSSLSADRLQDSRIHTIIPDSSIIGMLLCHSENYIVVKSSAFLIMQHDPYSWALSGPIFQYADRSRASIYFDAVTHSLLESIPRERREKLIDTAFDILSSAHSDSFHGMMASIRKNLPGISSKLSSLNKEDKEMLISVGKKLASILYKEFKDTRLALKETEE